MLKAMVRVFVCLVVAALILVPSANGQVLEKGTISGTVFDPTGAAVPNATVKITHVATGAERTVSSGPDGRYTAAILTAGEYTIEVSASGFATAVVKNVYLNVGQELIQDVNLKVAAVGQVVEVTGESGPIEKNEPLEKVVINQTYVDQLPINGRDFRNFATLAGTGDVSPALRSPVRLGGQMGEYTGLIIDGVDNRNSFFGEWFGSLETKNFTFPQDAIQEFQVREGGFSAEFGHATGGLINVVTKSGGNEFHGTAHWLFQTNSLTSSTFVEDVNQLVPPDKDTRHQFGFTVGGPIVRDRAWFFVGLDDQQQKGPLTAVFGDAGGIRILCNPPSNCPLPPEFGGGNLTDLEGSSGQRQDLLTPLIRLDYKFTPNHTGTTRFNYTRNETDGFTGFAGSQTFVVGRVGNNFENFVNEGWTVAQSVTSVIGSASVNEFRVSYSQEKRPRRTREPNYTQETIIGDGTGNFGPVFFLPIDSEHKRWQFLDNFSHTFGKHDIKLGVDANSNATNQVFIGFAGGQYNFASLTDWINRRPLFLLQRIGLNGLTATESGSLSDFWQHELSFYVQDNWKIHRNVTLNLGLRWDGIWNPKSDFGLPSAMLPVGRPRISGNTVSVDLAPASANVPNDFDNWAPRIGVAWDVMGTGKTIIRGGTGVYYAASPTIFFAGALAGPGLRGAVAFVPFFGSMTDLLGCGLSYPDLLPSTGAPCISLGPQSIDYIDPDFESARVWNIQAAVEQEIVPSLSVSLTYMYNRSDNLRTGGFFSTPWDRNLDPTGVILNSLGQTTTDGVNPTFNLPRLAANIDNANAVSSFAKARYHAFMIQVKKSYSHRVQFGANYVYSQNRDNASSDRDTDAFNGPSDPFNFLALDYGRSQLDIRNRFTFYGYFLLPADIELSTSVAARSGRAFPVWAATCSDPGIVAPFGLEGTGSPFHYRNSFQCSNNFDQIRPPDGGEVLGRYPISNNAFFNWDIRFGRDWNLGSEKVKLRTTFELFDILDNKNFFTNPTAGRNAILGDPDFRQRDQFATTRTAQFGLKIIF
ncbi:MAG TPA: carboxypeptidase regulatory-like domain-containing protein [Candidatus Xenobia bacterium]|nr:carboxypeptidase regulatory-like domain-containing protein [Candidatus Xenobia bacterium]